MGSLSTVARQEERLHADLLAQSLLEQAGAGSFASLVPGTADLPPVTRDGVEYRPRREVFEVPETESDLLKGVRVVVQWTDHRQRKREVLHELWISKVPR